MGEVHQQGHDDHGPAEGPQDQGERGHQVEAEPPADGSDHEIEDEQPRAAGQQIAAQLRGGFPLVQQADADPGHEGERGRAEVSDPAADEERYGRLGEVFGWKADVGDVVADVVERHEDDGDAAEDVDGKETH
jgi:hypothetical protein